MSYVLVFHPDGLDEYKSAANWYESEKEGLGIRFEGAIEIQLGQIEINPYFFSVVRGYYRQVRVRRFPFVIVYKPNKRKKQVYISAVHHTSRDPHRKFRKM
jgi:mRNA-degrading endonuclease RelE of RelBE toxin-antitoxin system